MIIENGGNENGKRRDKGHFEGNMIRMQKMSPDFLTLITEA